MKKYEINLEFKYIKILDGKVDEETQKVIDKIKEENSFGFDLPLINEIILKSKEIGKLSWTYKPLRYCGVCGKSAGYAKYKSGHNKGRPNHKKPLSLSGIAFNEGFITFRGMGDCCTECENKYNIIESIIKYVLDNNMLIEIKQHSHKHLSKYKKDEKRVCFNCKKDMYESQMKRHSCLMGNGTYPSGCPHCGAESLPFGRSHDCTNEFRMLKIDSIQENNGGLI